MNEVMDLFQKAIDITHLTDQQCEELLKIFGGNNEQTNHNNHATCTMGTNYFCNHSCSW